MPVTTRYDRQVLRLIPAGDYAWTDLMHALKGAMGQNGFAAGETVLVFDSRETSQIRSSEELRDIASDLVPLAGQFAAVMVVAEDDLRFGLARMLAVYAEHLGGEVLVFRSMEEAEAWIRAHGAGRRSRGGHGAGDEGG